jgi:hypothetical protein
MEAERAVQLHDLNWLRSHSYERWTARLLPFYESFGVKPADVLPPLPVRLWNQWVFHPVWSFAWSDQEELNYLTEAEKDLTALRLLPQQRSWFQLDQQLSRNHSDYHRPTAGWRFYNRLPLEDVEIMSGPRQHRTAITVERPSGYPYGDFSRALFWTFQNMTLWEMVRTAVAIKRYELRQGKPPSSLAALVPDFLDEIPLDLMDGQPLRYRLNPDGSFTLYSVGRDGRDDGGNALPESSSTKSRNDSPWTGRDWVWPHGINAN